MAKVTVTFEVDDEHVGGAKYLDEYTTRVKGELSKVQGNSECGLVIDTVVVSDYGINDQ